MFGRKGKRLQRAEQLGFEDGVRNRLDAILRDQRQPHEPRLGDSTEPVHLDMDERARYRAGLRRGEEGSSGRPVGQGDVHA